VYALFHIGRQKWSKAKSQTAGSGQLSRWKAWIPLYLVFFYLTLLILAVGLLTEVLRIPSFSQLRAEAGVEAAPPAAPPSYSTVALPEDAVALRFSEQDGDFFAA
jgi:hypothetical protein